MPSSVLRFFVALIGCVALSAQGALPRAIGRAFLDAGIRLDHVAIVVQDTTKLKPLFAYDGNRSRSPASVTGHASPTRRIMLRFIQSALDR